ncbi:MAG TPA: glycosyltransferase family 2 protein [Pseudomonas xinjiangensis]|uniref:Glycosyltransferase family 2 protein n=2 Tax=root TaxID=1 RepID=A0A7V1BRK5_9GAMM|nr:glycosyltransferase family 2 protein [Halopseudomonas xinjiangensis]HEC47464.1 glycosyltransferase family 2 protein [Halopseudomonas xinjiangensis]
MRKSAPVSVVVPCYRCGKTIGRALNSIAAQTLIPSEVLLVDDCSGDDTKDVLEHLRASFPDGWIKIISLAENAGPGAARNAGWEAAVEPYVAFLDADDSWHKRKIEIQYTFMENNPLVALSGHAWTRMVLNEIYSSYSVDDYGHTFTDVSKTQLMRSNRFSTPSVMLRRDIKHRFTDGKRYCEDYGLWTEICCSGLRCSRSPLPLAYLHKAEYGETGLSAALWKMEKGELDVYRNLYKRKYLGLLASSGLCVWSLIRFTFRLVRVKLKN